LKACCGPCVWNGPTITAPSARGTALCGWSCFRGGSESLVDCAAVAPGTRTEPVRGDSTELLATYLFLCITWVYSARRVSTGRGPCRAKWLAWSPGAIEWFYSPLPMVLSIVIAGHAIGVVAAGRAAAIHGARKDPATLAGRVDLPARPTVLRDPSALRRLRAAAIAVFHRRIAGWPQAGY
jgi:hypothetical protein